MIRVVVFDVSGVLVELTGVATFRSWLGNRLTDEEIWRRWLASPAVRDFETGRVSPDVFADELIDEFVLPVNRDELLAAFTAWPRRTFPGAGDLIRRVNRRFVRATLCNTNVLHGSRFQEMGLEGLFEHHFPSHLIGKLKPDREVFEHVIDVLRCEPSEMLFLDDQPLNIKSARQVGIEAILANGVEEAEQVLERFGVVDSTPA